MKGPPTRTAISLGRITAAAQNSKSVPVTADNSTRAETNQTFGGSVKMGGFGKFALSRELAWLDSLVVQRGDRDTSYSPAVFDLEAGPVTIAFSELQLTFRYDRLRLPCTRLAILCLLTFALSPSAIQAQASAGVPVIKITKQDSSI